MQATRADLENLKNDDLALHINAQKLEAGKHALPITAQQLLLPDTFKVVHYTPSNVVVDVHIENKEVVPSIT
jgi:hypothetical protein